ncbi:unnamed protein product, partial [Closterium sp. NIES-64]
MALSTTWAWPQCKCVPRLAPPVTVTVFPRNANDRRRIRATASSAGKSGRGSAGGRGGGRERKGGDAEWVTGGSWFEFDTDSLAVTSAPPDDDVSLTGDAPDASRPSDPELSASPSAGEARGSGRQDLSDAGGSATTSAAGGRLGGRLGGQRGGRTGGDRGARGGGRSGSLKDAELAEIMAASPPCIRPCLSLTLSPVNPLSMPKPCTSIHPSCIRPHRSFRASEVFEGEARMSFRASEMFEGEAQILSAIAATETVRVPRPIATGDFRTPSSSSSPPSSATTPNNESHRGSFIIMEHLQLRPFAMMDPANQEQLGRSLAQLHLVSSSMPGVQFGFNSPTRLGVMPLVNVPLSSSWPDFFLTHRLQDRLDRVLDRFGDEAWELRDIVPSLIEAAKRILTTEAMAEVRPSLLHGDLWVGNAGVLRPGEAVTFDPAGYYGHSEFDLAFRGWKPAPGFPGFTDAFYSAYHEVIPKAAGFEERQCVYQLFHLLNHVLI